MCTQTKSCMLPQEIVVCASVCHPNPGCCSSSPLIEPTSHLVSYRSLPSVSCTRPQLPHRAFFFFPFSPRGFIVRPLLILSVHSMSVLGFIKTAENRHRVPDDSAGGIDPSGSCFGLHPSAYGVVSAHRCMAMPEFEKTKTASTCSFTLTPSSHSIRVFSCRPNRPDHTSRLYISFRVTLIRSKGKEAK